MGDTGIEPVTSSVSGKRATAAPIAHSHGVLLGGSSCEVATGFEPVYTALQAAASPLGHATVGDSPYYPRAVTRADDEIRTRDPHLGKVMRYHCATSAFRFPLPGCIETLAHIFIDGQTGARGDHDGRATRRMLSPVCGKMVSHGRLAQLVARFLHTEEVISSSLVSPTTTYSSALFTGVVCCTALDGRRSTETTAISAAPAHSSPVPNAPTATAITAPS